MNRNLVAVFLTIGALVGALGYGVYQVWFAPPAFAGERVEPAGPAPDFTLESDHGPVSLGEFKGKYVLLYFGYSYCPDVCPTTLSDMKRVKAALDPEGSLIQGIYVSVDPRRDTPARMGEFARFYHPSFIGLSGSMESVQQAADAYQIVFRYNDAESSTNYTVDHTSRITVIDPDGNLRLYWNHGITAQEMTADLRQLMKMQP